MRDKCILLFPCEWEKEQGNGPPVEIGATDTVLGMVRIDMIVVPVPSYQANWITSCRSMQWGVYQVMRANIGSVGSHTLNIFLELFLHPKKSICPSFF